MPCKPRSRTCRAPRFTAACNATASPDCLRSKATSRQRRIFKTYPDGFFHVDIAEASTAEGKLHLFIAIDRTSMVAFARLVEKANTATAVAFLEELVAAIPYRIEMVLTDNGIQFLYRSRNAIERMFGRLKDFRRVATRYDRLASNDLAAVCLPATVSYWL